MKYRIEISYIVLLLLVATGNIYSQEHAAEFYMSPGWQSETRALPGTFTRHLDSLIGEYQTDWNQAFEERLTGDQLSGHLTDLRDLFFDRIGPFPEKTPLNASITGVVKRDGYRVEKIVFESRPSYFVTALLFLPDPDRFTAPYPGVLIPCGHAKPAKGHDEYQSMGALCALNGLAALAFDPIDQGERHQAIDSDGKPLNWGTRSHSLESIRATLLGTNMPGYFTWDGIRALDYLCSREEVDAERIGVSGNSGGGVQSSYLFAADDRIKVSAPSCYIHNIFTQARLEMGDGEQNVFGQIRDGLDHADYIMMRAPQPLKILAATHDFFRIYAVWDSYRFAKRYYTSLGFSERIDLMENDAGHNYNNKQREAAVQWMLRWLAGRDEVVREPEIELLSPEEYTCTPAGEVLLLPGALSIDDLFEKELIKTRTERKEFLKSGNQNELTAMIRSLTGMDLMKGNNLSLISEAETIGDGYTWKEMLFESGLGYTFPAVYFRPGQATGESIGQTETVEKSPIVFLSQQGTSYHQGEILKLVEKGHSVMSVELPGTGRLIQKGKAGFQLSRGLNWEDCNKAYLMGRSIVGYRARDILNVSSYLLEISDDAEVVDLYSFGEMGISSLHAAVLKPQMIGSVKSYGSIASWEKVVKSQTSFNQMANVVYNVLPYYDLPDLVEILGDKVKMSDPQTVKGMPAGGKKSQKKLSEKPELSGLAGVFYKSPGQINPEGPDWTESLEMAWDNKVVNRGRDWSAEWFGYLKAPTDGSIAITVSTDQYLDVYLDGKLEMSIKAGVSEVSKQSKETGKQNETKKTSDTIKLKTREGKYHSLRIVYTQDGPETSFFKFSWSWNGMENHSIPLEYIWHSPKQKALMESMWRQVDE